MVEKNIGISQQTLVSSGNPDGLVAGNKLPQYIAGLASTLGALAAGMVLGWTSSAGKGGITLAEEYGIAISDSEFSWIGALATLGAGAICVPIGILADLIGRKTSMLLLVVPFTIGWALIIWSSSVTMFYIGRFTTGLSGGAFCVTAPMYTSEIAESSIRGSLGSFFQLLLTVGILASYVLGSLVNMQVLSIISGIVPLIFFGVFVMMPETPTYHLKKGNLEAARASLIRLRGSTYNYEAELQMLQESIDSSTDSGESFGTAITSKPAIRGLIIGYGLMLFQQFSGVNAIIFYASTIFEAAGSTMAPEVSTIIVGVMQVVAVFVSSLIVDKLGRRLLLLVSVVFMFLTTLIMGFYFYFKSNGTDVSSIGWLPLLSICLFIVLFSLGFGPIPWMMMGEIFAAQIKGVAGSSACLLNWIMAFIVTFFFSQLQETLQPHGTFWLFSAFCAVGIVFVALVVPETKGKSLDEIQIELGATAVQSRPANQQLSRI